MSLFPHLPPHTHTPLVPNGFCGRYAPCLLTNSSAESRRDQEEEGELASHEEASPEEIKSREVVLGWRERERVGLPLLQLFPNGGATDTHSEHLPQKKDVVNQCLEFATDIVFVTLFCTAVGTAIAWYGGRCAMPDGHCLNNILLFWRRSTAALVFRVGACFEVSLFCPPFPTRPRP